LDDSIFTLLFLPAALAVIMFSLGLSLTPADFRRVVVFPRGVSIGLANLLAISPLLAFAVASLYSLAPEFAVGLVLLGASPGGTMANMLTHLARGDTALSITMTALSSLGAIATVPLYLALATDHFDAVGISDDVSMFGVVVRVLLITVIPVALGMHFRHRSPARVAALEPRFKRIAFAVFLLAVAGAVASEFDRATEKLPELGAAALTLNVLAMAISFTIAKLARLDDRQSTAIAMELGIHNSALAIAVGASISTELTIPAAVYSGFMFITAGLFARAMHRRNAPAPFAEPASG
jgi:BASS family bile acid:Na+ symporter